MGKYTRQKAPASWTVTPRELEILNEMALGLSGKEIGAKIGVELSTIRNAQLHILQRLEAQNGTHAVAIAIRRGLI